MAIMKEIWEYIISDYYRYYGRSSNKIKVILLALSAKNHCFTYSFWLRLCNKKNIFYYFARLMHYRLSRKYGIQIPINTKIGYGFYIGHGVGIVINGGTIIGNNVNISQFLSIGTNKNTPPHIGNNVYIGPSVCIVEDVKIEDNITIAAGTVVIKNIPSNSTVVGVPGRIIGYNTHPEYICNRYER